MNAIQLLLLACFAGLLACGGCASMKNAVGLPHSHIKYSSPIRKDVSAIWRHARQRKDIPDALLSRVAQHITAEVPLGASREKIEQHLAKHYHKPVPVGGNMRPVYFALAIEHNKMEFLGRDGVEIVYSLEAWSEPRLSSVTIWRRGAKGGSAIHELLPEDPLK